MNDRRGFTLVELIVVALIGSLLVMTAYQVLITNQRTYTVQNSKVQLQQNTRAATEILFNELREISSQGGDILDFDEQSLSVRAMRDVGVVCDNLPVTFSTIPQLLVRKVSDLFEVGDSVFIFADNDEYMTSDDTWIQGVVTSVVNTPLCEGTYEAQLLSFAGQSGTFVADTVREGAPIRSFTQYKYALGTFDGNTYLGRSEAGGDWVPLVGPLSGISGSPGLEMTYLDEDGVVTTDPGEVRRIVITVRSYSQARTVAGDLVVDSLTTSVFMRN